MHEDDLLNSIERIYILARAGVAVVGIDPQTVVRGQGTVGILGTGLSIDFEPNALGRKRPGWVVRQAYHSTDLVTNESRMGEEIVLIQKVEPGDLFLVVRAGILAIVRRQIEAALSSVAW